MFPLIIPRARINYVNGSGVEHKGCDFNDDRRACVSILTEAWFGKVAKFWSLDKSTNHREAFESGS